MPPQVIALQHLKELQDCGVELHRILLMNDSLAKFSPTFFGFALQRCHLLTGHPVPVDNCHNAGK
jgi:hypothetical protein